MARTFLSEMAGGKACLVWHLRHIWWPLGLYVSLTVKNQVPASLVQVFRLVALWLCQKRKSIKDRKADYTLLLLA